MQEQVNQAMQILDESRTVVEDKWLTFWLDKQMFGVSISNVEQIVSMQPITQVPDYPAYAKGIINLRGNVIPLVDLRLRIGKEETAYNDHTCIIIINMEERQIGFIVDEVDAVLDIPKERIAPSPPMGAGSTNRYLIGVARLSAEVGSQEKMVLCLDATMVLCEEERQAL